ncbi:MAG: Na+/H+ antiporter subunit E [Pseudomonadota bacterium]
MGYFIGLVIVLVLLWQGLSGMTKPLIWGLGFGSLVLTMVLCVRFDLIDREGSPYGRLVHLIAYWAWLMVEIFKANWIVIKACLRSNLDINPALVKVKTRAKTDLAKTVFANSITLTPGTVTIDIQGDKMLVHALYEEEAGPNAFDEMDRRSVIACDGKAALKETAP